MLQTNGLLVCDGLGGGLQEGSFGGGGFDVGGGFTVGLTGTMGFSVSVEGTGGQTLFSNLTTEAGLSSPEGGSLPSPPSSHILFRLEMEPVLRLLSSSSSSPSSTSTVCFTALRLALR